ncbi:sugar kinase [Acetobacteraceae bacterium KSS8]|uniref:Sugar kinase n=1 Tax=Endosaccharibacter trunci TaxID=2812733 RepID=A0ABT1W5R2_9PROT|nr:sugar kinase [Acetobacteraceae bacterium KSS8]
MMIVTLGEIVVEILAETRGHGFRESQPLSGPYPSGAPAIFIDQVARLDYPCGLISCVGDDDFGRLNIDRLHADGVDVSGIAVAPGQATGSAFVRYRPDGERDFVFNIRHSAAGLTRLTPEADALLDRARHLHVMGSSLFSPELREAAQTAIARVKARNGTISFDPNMRKEMLQAPGMEDALQSMLRHCDLFMPSGPELFLLSRADTEEAAIADLLGLGIGGIVVKRGAAGSSYHDRDGSCVQPAFAAEEIDPTGAGDCFGATFTTCRLMGHTIEASLRYANASGALAVGRRGPMEGTAGFAELDALIAAQAGRKDGLS